MNKKYRVRLSKEEREQLLQLVSAGIGPARQIRRAQILLKVDEGEQGLRWSGAAIGTAYNVSEITISEVRKAYVERGLEGALQRKKPERVYERRLDGDAEAHLIAVACSEPPTGPHGGHCVCSKRSLSHWRSWTLCRMKRFDRP